MMPFGAPFDEYYRDILIPNIRDVGLKAVRADEINKPGVIVNQIWKGIKDSTVCIADVSGRNANVMYELGMAHAIGRPVVQLVQRTEDLPFDLRAHRHIVYRTESPSWAAALGASLKKMLHSAIEEPHATLVLSDSSPSEMAAHEAAMLMVFVPEDVSGRMRTVLAKALRSCRGLQHDQAHDTIVSIMEQEIARVGETDPEDLLPEQAPGLQRQFAKGIAARMETILTEFSVNALGDGTRAPLGVLSELIDAWTPKYDDEKPRR